MVRFPTRGLAPGECLRDEGDWQLWQFGDSLTAIWAGGSARLPEDPADRPVLDPVIADSLTGPAPGNLNDEFRMAAVMAADDREAFLTALGGTEVGGEAIFTPGAETWLMATEPHNMYFGFIDYGG